MSRVGYRLFRFSNLYATPQDVVLTRFPTRSPPERLAPIVAKAARFALPQNAGAWVNKNNNRAGAPKDTPALPSASLLTISRTSQRGRLRSALHPLSRRPYSALCRCAYDLRLPRWPA